MRPLVMIALLVFAAPARAGDLRLADAPKLEHQTLALLLDSPSWPRRALGAARLERYGCDATRDRLVAMLDDDAWQVRAFAVASLGRRRVGAEPSWFADEDEPKVVRCALRHGYSIEQDRLERGARFLARSASLSDRLLAVELVAAARDEALAELADETLRKVIMRMGRVEAGALSPRLALVTGMPDLRRDHRWKRWYMGTGRQVRIVPGHAVPGDGPVEPTALARLDPRRLAELVDYIETLPSRRVDLAICLDTTASMSGELAQAQGGIDDLMIFSRDIVGSIRIALVAYRDRRDRYETRAWDFTDDIPESRRRLWQLTADGGGDTPEAVYPALKLAYMQLGWEPEHAKVLILIGDAPPHLGFGEKCVHMATLAREQANLTTHAIQATDKDVKHFPEIAAAGDGQCLRLDDDDSLIARITGLTLGDRFEEEFREFFARYMRLCR